MIHASIGDIALLEITDGAGPHLGCDQEWFGSWWKRTAGCGPSTLANIVYYIFRSTGEITSPMLREDFVRLMEDVWESVTPTMYGLSSTAAFVSGTRDFIRRRGLKLTASELPIARRPGVRPALSEVLDFIADILTRGAPVAFLALDNGDEKRLDTWHWITLLSVEQDGGGSAFVRVLDNGKLATVDLGLWLSTTNRGGGFAGVLPCASGSQRNFL